jgi:hypothetical protein
MTSIVQSLIRWFDSMFPGNMGTLQRKGESEAEADNASEPAVDEAPVPRPVEEDGGLRPVPRHFAPDDRSLATILAGIPKGLRTQDLYARPDLVFGSRSQRARRTSAPVPHGGTEDEAALCAGGVPGNIDAAHVANPLAVWPHWEDDSSSSFLSSWPAINPATGLPMVDGAMLDVAGNPYGLDLHHPDHGIDLHHHDDGIDLHHQDHCMDLHGGLDTVGHVGFDGFGQGGQGHGW